MRRRVGGSGSPLSDWGHRGLKRNENKKWGEQNTFQIWNSYILDSFHSKLSALEILISIRGAGGIKMLTKSRRKLKEEKESLDKTLLCQTPSQVPAMCCPNCWTVPGGYVCEGSGVQVQEEKLLNRIHYYLKLPLKQSWITAAAICLDPNYQRRPV